MRNFLLARGMLTVTTGFYLQHTRQTVGLISEPDAAYYVTFFRLTPNNDTLSYPAAMQNTSSSNIN
jgi:hypothetical protein